MLKRTLFVLILSCSVADATDPSSPGSSAADQRPSEASINELLEITRARQLVDEMISQMEGMMRSTMQQVTQGQPVPPEVQKTFDQCHSEVVSAMKEQVTWEKLAPMYVRIYQRTFTQGEVDGMMAFYKTPVGLALINKMPLAMQNSMSEVQQMLGPVMQRIQRMQHDILAQMEATKGKKSGS